MPVPVSALGLELRALSLASGRISYVDEGEGAPIVLLHGAPLTSLGFVRVIRELRKHHRVLAPDLPGFGRSDRSARHSGTLACHAAFVEEFCRALSLDGIVLYVNDASGSFGIAAAARLGSNVSGLVVADTVPLPLTGRAWLVKQVLKHVVSARPLRLLNRHLNLFAWLVATVAPWLRRFPASERQVLLDEFDTPEKRDRTIDLFEHMGRDDAFMREAAALARERLAKTPTLILYGQFDPMRLFGGAARFRRLFPNSVVKIIPLEEHFPILSSGERVARVVHDWIATLR